MRRTTSNEDNAFLAKMGLEHQTLLERAAEYIAENFSPEEVYEEQRLRDWAIDNGFVEKE